jgi:ribosomal protein S7
MQKQKNLSKNLLYRKFLGILIKKGKVTKAKKILDTSLFTVSKKLKMPINSVLTKVFYKLNTFVETKKITAKRKTNIVPFPISFSRRIYLILKWILLAVQLNKSRVPMNSKLSVELYKVVKNMPSDALRAKKQNNSQAYLNKSNIHFRW